MLDDLDRIEVISGSGGTLWGPNAVNGVINIISKSALDTQGGVVRGTASTRERTAAVRYGSTVGDGGAYRVYANGYNREGLPRSEEHTSELQSLMRISYAVFCLKKKKQN